MNKAQIRLVAGDDKREFGETREVAFLYRTDLWGAAVRAYRKATGRRATHVPLCNKVGDGAFTVQFGRDSARGATQLWPQCTVHLIDA